MDNQEDYADQQRGGIRVRDYTRGNGHGPMTNRQLRRVIARGGSEDGQNGSQPLPKINFDTVARSLVWVSLGLGLVEVFFPRQLQRFVGIRRGNYSGLIRLAGLREILHALLIFTQGRPHLGVWSRVAGDALDLGLLGAAVASPRVKTQKQRVGITAASLLGVTALDTLTAAQLTRRRAEEKRYSVLTKEDLDSRTRDGAFRVVRSTTINAAPETLYNYWRNFENLPRFMYHLNEVRVLDDRHSYWAAKAPAGMEVAWNAEITEDQPNEMIAWQAMEGSDVPNSGSVRFERAPGGRGTVVKVEIEYRPPGGAVGRTVAKLFGEEPGQQVKGDLQRFKNVIETGEVVRSDGSPAGFGQKLQRPAIPLTEEALRKQRDQMS